MVVVVPVEARHCGRARFLHHRFQRDVVLGRDFAAILVFRRRCHRAITFGKFHLDTAPSRFDLANLAPKLEARHRMKSHPDGRGLREQHLRKRIAFGGLREHRDRDRGAALLHDGRGQRHVASAGAEQPLHHMIIDLRIEVVDVGRDFEELIGVQSAALAPNHDAQHVGAILVFARARAIADLLDFEIQRHRRGATERAKDRRAGRRYHFSGTVAHSHRESRE